MRLNLNWNNLKLVSQSTYPSYAQSTFGCGAPSVTCTTDLLFINFTSFPVPSLPSPPLPDPLSVLCPACRCTPPRRPTGRVVQPRSCHILLQCYTLSYMVYITPTKAADENREFTPLSACPCPTHPPFITNSMATSKNIYISSMYHLRVEGR